MTLREIRVEAIHETLRGNPGCCKIAHERMSSRHVSFATTVLGWGLWGSLAAVYPLEATTAQDIGAEGETLQTSNYSLDAFRGPVIGTSRVVGLAGAVVAIAEGTEGGLQNPAAVANRPQQSLEWWDYWWGLGFVYPFDSDDYFNSGNPFDSEGVEDRDINFFFFNPALYFQFNHLGLGINIDLQHVDVRLQEDSSAQSLALDLDVATTHLQLGYGFLDGQLTIGVGANVLAQNVRVAGDEIRQSYQESGWGGEIGVLYRPEGRAWRLGASAATPIRLDVDADRAIARVVQNGVESMLFLPQNIESPWHGSVGFAYQFGRRPLNPSVTWGRKEAAERYQELHQDMARLAERYERARSEARQRGASRRELRSLKRYYKAQRSALRKQRKREVKEAFYRLRRRMRHGWPRRYLLVSTEVMFTGAVNDGIGPQALLAQQVQRSGEEISISPRLGIEGEPWTRRMKLRAGAYLEPSRYRTTNPRIHGTVGLDIRLFAWDVFHIWPRDHEWALTAAFDGARGYQAFSLGITGWY